MRLPIAKQVMMGEHFVPRISRDLVRPSRLPVSAASSGGKKVYHHAAGLTVVELIVTIVVLMILLASAWRVGTGEWAYFKAARDAGRRSDVESIAKEFERYYRVNASTSGPSYPTTAQVTSSLMDILAGANRDIVYAAGSDTVSLVSAANTAVPEPALDVYVYQPLTSADTLCTSAPCVRFNLYYRAEKTDEVVMVESMRQQ